LQSVLARMGFSYKSNGLLISPGEPLSLPIASEEAAVLDLQWNSTDDNELEFSLTFMPADGGEESKLMQSEKHSKLDSKFDISGPGSCVLRWTNTSSGWFGSVCTVAYTATLKTTREALEEQKKVLEAEIERARVETERLATERREKRDEQILKLRTESEASQVCLAETRKGMESNDVEISRLKEALTVAEEAKASELAMVGVLEKELSASREAIEALSGEQARDDGAISKENGKDQAEEEKEEQGKDGDDKCKEEKNGEEKHEEKTNVEEKNEENDAA